MAEPHAPESLSTEGVEAAGLTTELGAHLLEGEGGLGRRRTVKTN